MNLAEIIDGIRYSIAGEEAEYHVNDEDDYDNHQLTIYLHPCIKLIDYLVIIDDEEIEISGIEAQLRYKVTFTFDSLDVVQDTCSYKTDVEFKYAYIMEMQEHDDLRDYVNDQIEADIRDGRNIVLDEPEFKVILKQLQ